MKNIKIPATIDKAANLGKPVAKKEHEITVLDAGIFGTNWPLDMTRLKV